MKMTETSQTRLHDVALFASRERQPSKAVERFIGAVTRDATLIAALVGDAMIRRCAEQYLQRFAASEKDGARGQFSFENQRTDASVSSATIPGEGQKIGDGLVDVADTRSQLEDVRGQVNRDAQCHDDPASSIPLHGEGHGVGDTQTHDAKSMQPVEGGSGHVIAGAHSMIASLPSPDASRVSQQSFNTHFVDAHSAGSPRAPIPMPSRAPSAMASIQGIMAKAIVFRLQDGRNIMDAQFGELARIERDGVKVAKKYAREAIVARYLRENCRYANPDPFEKVGNYFPIKTLELALAEADKKEICNV